MNKLVVRLWWFFLVATILASGASLPLHPTMPWLFSVFGGCLMGLVITTMFVAPPYPATDGERREHELRKREAKSELMDNLVGLKNAFCVILN